MTPSSAQRPRISRGFLVSLALVLAAAAGVLYYAAQLRRAAGPEDDGTYIPRDVPMSEEIRLLQQYVQIDTQNPPGNEIRGAKFLHDYLASQGVSSEIIESAPGRASLYARIKGDREGGALLLLHHIDVAPVDESQWTEPAFSGSLRRNLLWGRGTLDMKGIGIAHLSAFVKVAKSKRRPKHDLIFLAVADEETGGRLGMKWIIEKRPEVMAGVEFVLSEGGTTDIVRDQLVFFGVEIGSKQLVQLRVAAGEEEVLRSVRFALEPYFEPSRPARVLPAVRDYFSAIAPSRIQGGELLADVQATVDAGKFWVLDASYRELLTNSVAMSGIRREGEDFAATIILKNLPDEKPADRLRWLTSVLEPLPVRLEPTFESGPAAISTTESELYRLIATEVRKLHGEAVGIGPVVHPNVVNDCRFLRSDRVICYGVSPFLVDYFHSKGIHGVDEQLRLDWFSDGMKLIDAVVSRYCFGE